MMGLAQTGTGKTAAFTLPIVNRLIHGPHRTRALVLTPVNAAYGFDYVAAASLGAKDGWHVTGTIANDGTISTQGKDPSGLPPCPICLARGTRIATPSGEVPVEDISVGMDVWTSDRTGRRMVGSVMAAGSSPVPTTHRVVNLVLDDGRTLDVSPGHPLPDGRRLGDLRPGDVVDGARVVSADLVPYRGGATFDLLSSGRTGTYWANGILLASTLEPVGLANELTSGLTGLATRRETPSQNNIIW